MIHLLQELTKPGSDEKTKLYDSMYKIINGAEQRIAEELFVKPIRVFPLCIRGTLRLNVMDVLLRNINRSIELNSHFRLGLHVAILDSVRTGLIRGIKVGYSDVNLNHLFFADDVIIMSDWSSHDMENIIRIFKVFFLDSGLKINIHNSSIYGVGVPPEEIHHMASNTGCSAGSFPITYLGFPIGSNMSLTANWKLLVDKFHSKLSSWKASLL
ncbi:hypothetical protein Tco_1374657, partial [Tanacetum coccineum]